MNRKHQLRNMLCCSLDDSQMEKENVTHRVRSKLKWNVVNDNLMNHSHDTLLTLAVQRNSLYQVIHKFSSTSVQNFSRSRFAFREKLQHLLLHIIIHVSFIKVHDEWILLCCSVCEKNI